jgi:hypothetical protein
VLWGEVSWVNNSKILRKSNISMSCGKNKAFSLSMYENMYSKSGKMLQITKCFFKDIEN